GVVGAAFGEGFATLHETVKNVIGQAIMFKSVFEDLSATLESLESLVKEIRRLNLALDLPEKEIERLVKLMKNGTKLVDKCSKIQPYNIFSKAYYALKIKELNEAIEKFCKVELQVQIGRTTLQTLVGVNDIRERMNNQRMRFGLRTLSVSRPRDYIVGLDLPLKELKMELKKKEEQVLLLTALGGCGKTTLVKMLCWDDEIKGIYGENIFFVNVSQAPNLKVMVQKLFNHNHNGQECPVFQSDEEAIDQLEQLLDEIGQRQPILLILDDVWPGSESLIEKFKFDIPAYKIVVTSRTAFPKFKSKYNLNPLDPEDAMSLFCRSASFKDVSSYFSKEKIEKVLFQSGTYIYIYMKYA
ncbi:putative disease resistance protein, partial [Quercus suber]